ncbi:Nop13p NDAI_0F03320 [Naumovozyma dairenensis CBS 421]|uniref:RRM domain-containing protein n=1 Tax=Naumovozyma dairenensis (strain ATCC 10597 / BCRC 20456 / CBS 421 / NBRC 0211 / NRRL Y-12639) TaxID=1071378 RepID=G0WCY9_NAUDC|nr:hypothetical protein NDAI_0F03320 [Naumovozyma dairenensis CBS 421]CCD25650.1 hypothetical protein NDAI_0F03320 [Naumovozyma dairenensis CBS 421]
MTDKIEVQTPVTKEAKTEDGKNEEIEKALVDPTKKRKAEDEIEIDLSSSIPLSKKQKRLLRRGKITLEELNAKYNIDPSSIEEYKNESESKKNVNNVGDQAKNDNGDDEEEDKPKTKKSEKERKFSVWIGNLSFDTTKEEIIKFFVAKTKSEDNEASQVTENDIIRVNMPLAKNDGKKIKNKGFCYMDFKTKEQLDSIVKLSENQLNGRNLLIKNSKDYDGRPDKNDLVSMSKNPPSRILFVGNLSFDTTDELLRKHFQHCGEIIKIRMATFEDSGKCKGFAFVDFKNEEGATNALKDKTCRKIAGRPLRMEFGEDRSKRQVRRKPDQEQKRTIDIPNKDPQLQQRENNPAKFRTRKTPAPHRNTVDSNNRIKSSIALRSAQRASAAIVPSQGKKMKFD